MAFKLQCRCGSYIKKFEQFCPECGKKCPFEFEENGSHVVARISSTEIILHKDKSIPSWINKSANERISVRSEIPVSQEAGDILKKLYFIKKENQSIANSASLVGNVYGSGIILGSFFGIATSGASEILSFCLGLGIILAISGNVVSSKINNACFSIQRDIDIIRLFYGVKDFTTRDGDE